MPGNCKLQSRKQYDESNRYGKQFLHIVTETQIVEKMLLKGRVILICCSFAPGWLGNINSSQNDDNQLIKTFSTYAIGLKARIKESTL